MISACTCVPLFRPKYGKLLWTHNSHASKQPFSHRLRNLDGEIWELRPLRNRFLYAYYKDNRFIILHRFLKKTQKTPKREIEQAKRNLQDYLESNLVI
ncbi:MAG: hypothetical protein HFH05_12875 [Lachnospiraceae bacterium]|nr:hypothetical protein [Lachnospiraceae bacterium]MCI9674218.1 hypothetical protein [Lachnospiraceae bacterium]